MPEQRSRPRDGRVIALANQKGGTGKTTTTVNLGIGLARLGKKVLLIDADPQGDLTTCLGWQDQDSLPTTLATVMEKVIRDEPFTTDEGILHHSEGVDLMPANIELSALEMSLVNAMSREFTLRTYVNEAKKHYDVVLIDCMPSLGMITINALAAADSVIIPVQAHYLPAKGMTQLMKTINKVKRQINPALKVDGVLLTLVDGRTNLARQTADTLRQSYGSVLKIYRSEIPVAIKAAEISAAGKSIYAYMNFLLENGLVVHNSGKSFSAKREIVNVFLLTDDSIIIADPENEYGPLVKRFGKQGQVIDLSPTSSNYINPLDINLDYSDDENPITLKSDFVLSLCDLIIGGKDGLTPIEKTIIDRCTRLVYRDYLQDPRPENMPILGDLYELLRKQSEPEAQNIATALEIYVNGSLNVFNHRSNIDMDSHRVLCFQLKSLGKALKEIGLLIMQDAVWNRVTANREKHKTTWFYIDEFHLLLKGQTGAFSVEIWKRFRKWGGIPSGLTQNVKDLLASREIENIFENSDFIYMLNQAQGDRQILAKQLGISPTQLSYVTHSGPGEGLLFFGNVIIPFVDHFPKDTSLYQIMTTRPEEVAEAGT